MLSVIAIGAVEMDQERAQAAVPVNLERETMLQLTPATDGRKNAILRIGNIRVGKKPRHAQW